jgi:hypothetical protein
MICKKCHQSFEDLIIKSVTCVGIRLDPYACEKGGEHDWHTVEDSIAEEYLNHDPDERWPGKNMSD